jgi:hypothetical protein
LVIQKEQYLLENPSKRHIGANQERMETMTNLLYFFAAIGVLATGLVMTGLYLDISNFDQTSGGYEAPYSGVSGNPVDWFAMDRTAKGLAKRGHVVNVLVDGTTGMISFEFFSQTIDFRPFSDRALVVHKPREVFISLGFQPEF